MKNKITLLLLLFLFLQKTNAQIEVSQAFQELLTASKSSLPQSLLKDYKVTKINKNYILNTDFTILSKKKDLEIQFHLRPERDGVKLSNPHMKCFNMANSAATNNDETEVKYYEMPKSERAKYNADWGAVFYFQPKEAFSKKKECKLITLYSEGKGIATIFYLYDAPTKEIKLQKYCFKFSN